MTVPKLSECSPRVSSMNIRIRLGCCWLIIWGSATLPALGQLQPTQPAASVTSPLQNIQVEATVFCIDKIDVAAQSDGLIERMLVDEGDSVAKGDTLLMIDSRVADAELSVAKKEQEAAAKQAEQTAEIEYAQAAADLSREEYDAERDLYSQNSTTFSQLKRKRLEAQRAIFSVDVAKVQHDQEVLAADVAEEKVKAAEVRLELYRVLAPFEGVIVERKRGQGEWIRSGDPVLRLLHMNEMKVEALVPVDNIAVNALEGAPITIQVQINPQQVANYDATIDFVSHEIRSRRVRISARIENRKLDGIWLLRDGMTASAEIHLNH